MPPLRERREDLPELVRQLLSDLAEQSGYGSPPVLSPSVLNALLDYQWPGNVRELKSVLQRILILSELGEVTVQSLGLVDISSQCVLSIPFPKDESLNDVLGTVKQALIQEALKRTGGKRQEAARLLGISRNSLKHHMRVSMERERSKREPVSDPD